MATSGCTVRRTLSVCNSSGHCRSLDMTLSEIRALLGLRDNPMQDCGEVNTLLEAHIQTGGNACPRCCS